MPEKIKQTLLVVFAHPDDESFGMGGTLAYYASHGVAVHLICATRGEVGTVDPKHLEGFSSIAELRESELRCAASSLGLAGVHFLDYRDSGMPGSADNQNPSALINQPLDVVARRVADYMRQLKPQVVVTFDPIGGYKHPDHIHIHQATVQAFSLAGDMRFVSGFAPYQPVKLYYTVFPKSMFKLAVRLMPLIGQDPRHFGRNKDIDILDLVESGDFPIHARVRYHGAEQQSETASACHASQLPGGPRRGPMSWIMQLFPKEDTFMRAFPPAPAGLKEKDLFEGI